MSKTTRKTETAALRAEAIELRLRGVKLATIAKKVGRSVSTVSGWLSASEAHGLPTSNRGRKRKSPTKLPPEPKAGAATSGIVEALGGDVPPPMMPLVKERLPQITSAANAALEQGDRAAYRDFVKMEVDLARQLMAMIPPKPPDPELDPAYAKARERLRQLYTRLVEDRDRRCEKLIGECCPACKGRVTAFLNGGDP